MAATPPATAPPYQLGAPDLECRYPVLVDDQHLGLIFRWHGAWFANPAGQDEERRVGDGGTGKKSAALHLVNEFTAGRITAKPAVKAGPAKFKAPIGPVELLHPRMPSSNAEQARRVMALLDDYLWRPLSGYPGSDNPWFLQCLLCGWAGPRYWSHLRGRKGNPPSPYRHPGTCIGADKVRERIAAYQK